MSDRAATVLHILGAADRLGEPPTGRIVLVKLTYLTEILRPTYDLWTNAFKFVRYRYGPYTDDVFQCANYLVFHRCVDVIEYSRSENAVHALYKVTEEGRALASRLAAANPRGVHKLAEDVVWSLQALGIRSAKDICALVYSEPAFAQTLRDAEVQGIPATDATPLPDALSPQHPSFRVQAVLRALASSPLRAATPRQLVHRFLVSLSVGMHHPGASINE